MLWRCQSDESESVESGCGCIAVFARTRPKAVTIDFVIEGPLVSGERTVHQATATVG